MIPLVTPVFPTMRPACFASNDDRTEISVATLTANAAYQGWRGRSGELTGSRRNRAPHPQSTNIKVKHPLSGVLPS